jgi:polar amino acid transport system ATP-binding protein
MSTEILKLENVSAGYKNNVIIRDINFSVYSGERLIVMGPNGSGKSTLLKAILRLVNIFSGSIIFDGTQIEKLPESKLRLIRARIGYLPQGGVLFPHMKIIDNVAIPLRVVFRLSKQEAYQKARHFLSLMGVEELANRYPAQLSGGQRQRVAIARALSTDPKILLLDEPTSGLDPESRVDVLNVLYDLAKLGKAMIVVTHETDFAKRIADRVIVIKKGSIEYIGSFSQGIVDIIERRGG